MRRSAVILAIAVGAAAIVAAAGGAILLLNWAENQQAVRLLAEARAEMQAGRAEEAMRLFARYLVKRRDDDTARREYANLFLEKLAGSELSRKGNARAFKLLESVVSAHPTDHWLRFQLARFLVRINEVTSALRHLSVLRQALGPEEVIGVSGTADGPAGVPVGRQDVDNLYADALVRTGRFREAIDDLSARVGFDPVSRLFPAIADASHRGPRTTAAFGRLAHLLENEVHDEEAAARVVARCTAVNADDAAAWIALAQWNISHEGDVIAASDAVRRATALAPDDSAVMSLSMTLCANADRFQEATAIAERGLELHPLEEWPYVAKASLRLREKDVQGTIDAVRAGLQGLGGRPALLQLLADVPDEPCWNDAIEAALTEFGPALAGEERFRSVLEGRVHMGRGRWLEAIRALEAGRAIAGTSDALKLTADLALAKCHEQVGDLDLQLADCQRAVVENGSSADALAGYAKAMLACGRLDEALGAFRRAVNALPADALPGFPDLWAPLLRLEYMAAARGLPERRGRDAIDALAASLAEAVAPPYVPLLAAERLAGEAKIDEAIDALDTARLADPGNALLAAAAISLRARGGRTDRIADMVDGLSAEVRDDPKVLAAVDEACRLMPPSAAVQLADESFARRPDDLRAAMTALSVSLRLGRRDHVAALAGKVAALAGDSSTHARYAEAALWVLGRRRGSARLSKGDKDELAMLRDTLAEIDVLRPKWTELQGLLAEIDLLEGKTHEAVAHCRQAFATRPTDPEIVRPLARLLMQSQQFAEAEQLLGGLDARGVHRLGRIAADLRLRAGKTDEAVAIAMQEATGGGEDPDDLLWLADCLARNGKREAAGGTLLRGVALAPDRLDLWLALADHQAAGGDDAAAAVTLERAADRVDDDLHPLLAAEIERRAGRMDAAVSAFRTLLEGEKADSLLLRRAAECFLEADLASDARTNLERLAKSRSVTMAAQEATRWARRRLTELSLRDGTFPQAQEALQVLADNSGGTGTCTPEDADLAAGLLAHRPEPESWRMALKLLEGMGRQQTPTAVQNVLAARLRGRLGDVRRARDELQDLAVQHHAPAAVYSALVELLLAKGEPAVAAEWIDELVAQAGSAPETIALQARLALAQDDRPAAVAAAKRLMPEGEVTARTVASVLATATTMEEFGFMAAADSLLERSAAVDGRGTIARVAFLLRRDRLDEAAQLLGASRDSLSSRPDYVLQEAALSEKQGDAAAAEAAYRRLLDDAGCPMKERIEATACLAWCLLDRDAAQEAFALVDKAIFDLGPHPDLLDARGVARVVTGNMRGAIKDLKEASIAPTPRRLLHMAHAWAVAKIETEARAIGERAMKSGLDPAGMRPSDSRQLDVLVRQLGLTVR